jgi:O-methyltransferase involved in polyketide biosynthesis
VDILSAVSETALITLKARVQEAEKDEPVIKKVISAFQIYDQNPMDD